MLRVALLFLSLAALILLLGLNGVAGVSLEAGRMLLLAFVGLAVVSALVALATGRKPPTPL